MRKLWNRLRGNEGSEDSRVTQAELNRMERKLVQYEKRIEHLRRERLIYEQRHRGIT